MKILIGVGKLGVNNDIPPYVSYLMETKSFAEHKIRIVPYGAQNAKEGVLLKVLLLPIKILRFLLVIVSFRPDIIHLNSSLDSKALFRDRLYIFFMRIFGRRACIEYHGTDIEWFNHQSRSRQKSVLRLMESAKTNFFLSSEEADFFMSQSKKMNSSIVKVPIMELSEKVRFRKEIDSVIKLLYVGRLMKSKGIMDILESLLILKQKDIRFHLVIAGSGLLEGDVLSFISKNELKKDVTFLGWVSNDEVLKQFSETSIFLLPTYHQEGLPIVILMALQYGLPIITTKIRGAADYLIEGENCLWTEPRDPVMLAEKIIDITSDNDKRVQMFYNNISLSEAFLAENVAMEFISKYEEILKDSKTVI